MRRIFDSIIPIQGVSILNLDLSIRGSWAYLAGYRYELVYVSTEQPREVPLMLEFSDWPKCLHMAIEVTQFICRSTNLPYYLDLCQ